MGCNCGKKARTLTTNRTVAARQGVVYDVVKDGNVLTTKKDPVVARAEARRSQGTVVPRTVSAS